MDLTALRQELQSAGLERADLADDPIEQFQIWFDFVRTSGLYQPDAMALATSNAAGDPTVRLVLLKGADAAGFVFFTNYESPKADDLDQNPRAGAAFGWHELDRQVRIRGAVAKISSDESDQYFATRPYGSQLGAWASAQSHVIADRSLLEERVDELKQRWPEGAVPRPPNWGGYRIHPDEIEFWQGRADRLHDRFRYRRSGGSEWVVERLSP